VVVVVAVTVSSEVCEAKELARSLAERGTAIASVQGYGVFFGIRKRQEREGCEF